MQPAVDQTSVLYAAEVRTRGFTARQINDTLAWGEGAIQPRPEYATTERQQALLAAVLTSIEPVSASELPYSACTDGRLPVTLLDGEPIPVREQMVGADIVSAFYVAEVLGASFYKDPHAPVHERIKDVVDFLKANGLEPSSHVACGAAGGFVAISQNIVRFSKDKRFMARLHELLPQEVYEEALYKQLLAEAEKRLATNMYEGLSGQLFLDAAMHGSGQHAIAELKDDGRGVYGHVEEHIIRVQVPGYAINGAKVAELAQGREVFGVNDDRITRIARLFGRGNDRDYKQAYMALEAFADAGHGTLAKALPTWIVTSA